MLILRRVTQKQSNKFFTNHSMLFWSIYRKVLVSYKQYHIVYIRGFSEFGTQLELYIGQLNMDADKYRKACVFVCLNNTKAYRIC